MLLTVSMATEENAKFVETCIGYSFRSRSRLLQALTAAGAVENDHDGNRKLAQLGAALIEFLLVYIGYEADSSRGKIRGNRDGDSNVPVVYTTNMKIHLGSFNQRAMVAQRTGIDRCIKYDDRPGSQSPRVLGKAVNAIIAAVFLDSKDITLALRVMVHLGLVATRFLRELS
jgi:dsRNA-specific ribonuclease